MPLTRIKNQFTELGPVIARGGLSSGVEYFANSVGKLAKVTGKGLAGLGGELGSAARQAGNISKSAPFLAQVSTIFEGLRPILRFILSGLLSIAQALLNLLQASIPMATKMASMFADVAESLRSWTAAQLANGNMAKWLIASWDLFRRVVGVIVDVLIGVFNVFKIGAGYAGEMGLSVESAARSFRTWTGSAEGQARINKYFQDSLPALREMGKLLGLVVGGLASLGANQNVAPLLAQIRTEFVPALAELLTKLSGQGGLGPALIDAATAIVQLFAGLDFSALTLFVQGIAAVVQGLVWLAQNVPGANIAISALLGTLIGFKLLSPVWALVAGGAQAFSWVGVATKGVGELSLAQKLLGPGFRLVMDMFSGIAAIIGTYVIPAIKAIAVAGVGALRTLSIALFTTPIGWLILGIMLIVGGIILLWTKCAWFRDAVKAVWEAIRTAAIAVWDAIKVAVSAVIDFFVAAWEGTVNAFRIIVGAIVAAAQWIWQGIKPIVDVLVAIFTVAWDIIKGIVQVAVYIIVAIVTLIAITMKATWDAIVMVAQWVWNSILLPIFTMIGTIASDTWNLILAVATTVWNAIVAVVMWFWNTILSPIFTLIGIVATALWNGILWVAQAVWNGIVAAVQFVWGILQPIFQVIGAVGAAVWDGIKTAASAVWDTIKSGWSSVWDWLSGLWDKLSGAGTAVWDGIKAAASAVADVVKGVWNKIVDAFKGVWNWIAKGWNAIPDITVPDWVPLIGGKTFGLPKMPMLWHGGEAPGGRAIVGEHGPEPLVVNGTFKGLVGANGPEVASIPKGGYVVPNLSTLNAFPGLAKSIPSGVARAVAANIPGYAPVARASGDGGLARAVSGLAAAVMERPPPISASGADVAAQVEAILRKRDRERDVRKKYSY